MKRIFGVYITIFLTCITGSLMARDIFPQYDSSDGSIKFVANWPLCGSFLIKPRKSTLEVDPRFANSELWLQSWVFNSDNNPSKELSMIKLPAAGIRPRYHHAKNFRPGSFYKIYLIKRNYTHGGKFVDERVDFKDYVDIIDPRHNKGCFGKTIGGAGGKTKPMKLD